MFQPPLKGTPRPAGLERLPEPVPEGKRFDCSMGPMGICRSPGSDAVLLVRMKEGGKDKSAWHVYALCEACAREGGDGDFLDAPQDAAPPLPAATGWERELKDTG